MAQMMDSPKSDSEQQPSSPEWVPAEGGIAEIYTNYINANWTLVDVRFRLGQLVPKGEIGGPWKVEERAGVTLAWPHLKLLYGLMGEIIRRYEAVNGEIKQATLPPGDIPPSGR